MRKLVPLFVLCAACGGHSNPDDMGVGDMAVELADLTPTYDVAPAAIVAPAGQWTWIDVDGTTCNDGTQTGMAVNPGTQTDKLFILFEGGGACGDYDSCYTLMTAQLGPYGATQFADAEPSFTGSIMDRTLAANPFAAWTFVYIPYCTGDLHGGIESPTYTQPGGTATQVFHHMGHINALRDFDRLQATWPTLSTLVVSGTSAGGYGSIINYDDARKHWSSAKGYLLDDSGPPLEGNVTPPNLTEWIGEWGLLKWALGVCPGCTKDVSQLVPSLSAAYPNDRLALLESLEDMVIRMYYFLQPADFTTAVQALATDRIDPTTNFKYFYIAGDTHTMLYTPTAFSVGSTPLMTFITQEVTDDPAWASHMP